MSAKTNKVPIRKAQQNPLPFRALMTQERNSVMLLLQLGGNLTTTPDRANELDWQHTIVEALASVMEDARFDLSDPVVARGLKRRLAVAASACEMWADQLEGLK